MNKISDAARDDVAKAIADVIGHGMREKCAAHADAALEAALPHMQQAALASVQPSPAGQGDVLAACPLCGSADVHSYYDEIRHVGYVRCAGDFPRKNCPLRVDMSVSVANDSPAKAREAAEREWNAAAAALAARQAVGQVIEYQSYHGYGGGQWSTCDKKLYDNGKAFEAKYGAGEMSLYRTLVVGDASPNAQAVDLNRVRAAVKSMFNWIDDWAETPEESGITEIEAEAEAVITMIDSSKAVQS